MVSFFMMVVRFKGFSQPRRWQTGSRGLIACQSDKPDAFKGRNPLDSTSAPGHKGRVRLRAAKRVRRSSFHFGNLNIQPSPPTPIGSMLTKHVRL